MNQSHRQRYWILYNLALVLFSTVIALCIGEMVVRHLMGDRIVLFPRYVTEARYDNGVILRKLIPHSTYWHTSIDGRWEFRTNAQGFRDDHDYLYAKPANTLRVLVLGDSHTQGFEVRQNYTFSKLLEQRLLEQGVHAEVLNTGISGFGTAEELMFLETEGMKYHPDVVVLGFFSNDYDDNLKSGLYTLDQGKLTVRKYVHAPGTKAIAMMYMVPGVSWLSQHSYLFSLILNTVWEAAKKQLQVITRAKATTEYVMPVSSISQYEEDLVIALLHRMKEVTQSAGIPLVLVEIPAASNHAIWEHSLSNEMADRVRAEVNFLIPADQYLGNTKSGIHLLHGHQHISEQTHAQIAASLDQAFHMMNIVKQQ